MCWNNEGKKIRSHYLQWLKWQDAPHRESKLQVHLCNFRLSGMRQIYSETSPDGTRPFTTAGHLKLCLTETASRQRQHTADWLSVSSVKTPFIQSSLRRPSRERMREEQGWREERGGEGEKIMRKREDTWDLGLIQSFWYSKILIIFPFKL